MISSAYSFETRMFSLFFEIIAFTINILPSHKLITVIIVVISNVIRMS